MNDKGFTIGIIVLIILAIGGIILFSSKESAKPISNEQARNTCIQHTNIQLHIHPELKIFIEGQPVAIPTNVGVTDDCMRGLHTHDDTGKLHVEYLEPFDFKLGDFFAVWGQTFNRSQILDKAVDDKHIIEMLVDGQPSTEFENLVLQDQQKIEIHYKQK